jgi:hypothetical protein
MHRITASIGFLLSIASATPALGEGSIDAIGALQRHQARLTERTTIADCDDLERSLELRNVMSPSRRRTLLLNCRDMARQNEERLNLAKKR